MQQDNRCIIGKIFVPLPNQMTKNDSYECKTSYTQVLESRQWHVFGQAVHAFSHRYDSINRTHIWHSSHH